MSKNEEVLTPFSDIFNLFLNTIQDYRIAKMFADESKKDMAVDLLNTFLYKAISKFDNCVKDIANVDMSSGTFNVALDIREKTILSDLMVLSWLDWNINDIRQMNWTLNDNDFRHYSEEKNLREKSMYADRLREKVYQDMTDYGYIHTPFKEWAVGNYDL